MGSTVEQSLEKRVRAARREGARELHSGVGTRAACGLLAAWAAIVAVNALKAPANQSKALLLSLPALAVLAIATILFFAWDGWVMSRRIREAAKREFAQIGALRSRLEAPIGRADEAAGVTKETRRADYPPDIAT